MDQQGGVAGLRADVTGRQLSVYELEADGKDLTADVKRLPGRLNRIEIRLDRTEDRQDRMDRNIAAIMRRPDPGQPASRPGTRGHNLSPPVVY